MIRLLDRNFITLLTLCVITGKSYMRIARALNGEGIIVRKPVRILIGGDGLATCHITGYAFPENLKYKLNNNKKLRDTFNNLLETVTSVNRERLNALNKYNDLQNYFPKIGLRSDDEIVAVIIPSAVKINENTDEDDIDLKQTNKDKDENIDENLIDDTGLLRQWKGCNKSAAKTCRKACKKTYKEICDDYKCSKSMKRSFKKACKRNCNSQFRGDDY